MKVFKSNRTFKLWAYIVSHSSLLIRSEMKYPDQEEYSDPTSYNIDLEFWAVRYINIPSILYELSIKEIMMEELPEEINKDFLKYDMKVFEIISGDRKYYIIAGGVLIGENKWGNQDRILNLNLNLKHDEILFQSEE
ncbi:hypothetical protein [Chryseobacterium sp. CT-SW4]|uniref:hypothetical protein n=1 Tax=Chryseobacterium sp. SW-1 TaxID=3157343 RepID=UPI003B015EDB